MKPHYVIVTTTGKLLWQGTSESQCALEWRPGTFWGGGYKDKFRTKPRTESEALAHALEYVAARGEK